MSKLLLVVYNPASGDSVTEDVLRDALASNEHTLHFADIHDGVAALESLAKTIKPTAIIAVGGDGTVSAVAAVAIRCDLPLGVIPAGTLNHFAKDMGIPLELPAAAKLILQGRTQDIDYCTVNERVFLNNSSIGIYPLAVRQRESLQPRIGKKFATIIATLRAAAKFSATHLTLSIDGTDRTYKTPLVFIGNNSYGFDEVGLANRGSLTDGNLFIYVVRANRLTGLIRLLIPTYFGKHVRRRVFLQTTASDIVISSRKSSLSVSIDGEVESFTPPLRFSVHSKALKVYS